ncbi:MAG: ABC transporter permease [Myxococcaceae bacterium]
MWFSFWAVFQKEFLHIRRDPGTLRLALFVPVMQMLVFGFIDQTVHDVPTVVVDQDRSSESRLLMDKLVATKTFRIREVTESPEVARTRIREGKASVGVVIPPGFREKQLRRETAQILVLIDGSDSTVSAQALASINGLVVQANLARIERVQGPVRGIAAQPIVLFNPSGKTANYIIPGLIAVILQIAAVILASSAIVRERERGTLEQLMVTPLHPLGLMLGKLGPYLFLSFFEMSVALLLMRFVFDVPIQGSVSVLFVSALVYLFALLALGLLISTRAQTQMEAQQLSQLFFLPAIFLSGYIFPFSGLPLPLRLLGQCFPVTHMIAIMRGVVLRNASVWELLPHFLALCGMSLLLVGLAARSTRKVAA